MASDRGLTVDGSGGDIAIGAGLATAAWLSSSVLISALGSGELLVGWTGVGEELMRAAGEELAWASFQG